jgi:hypothetical protein
VKRPLGADEVGHRFVVAAWLQPTEDGQLMKSRDP